MTAANQAIHRKDYQPPNTHITTLSMRVDIQSDYTEITSTLNYHLDQVDKGIKLHGEALELQHITLEGTPLSSADYAYDQHILHIPDAPQAGQLVTIVRIYPDQNKALEGFYRSGGMLTTQCEAEGFRRITFFNDRPDVLSLFDVRLEADQSQYPVLLSNGNCIDQGVLENGRHFTHWQDPIKKPCYLFAMVAGEFSVTRDQFTTRSGKNVQLAIYTEPHNADKTAFAMTSLINAMRWDETRFGLEYDLDTFMIVAVDHFNMGAMENKGLNIFNTQCVLANPSTATDTEYRRIESIIGHEYFHNWTGNRVTCRSWFELSLKEGLTVFRDQEFSADMGARDIQRIEDVTALQAIQFPEDSGPMAHPVRPESYEEINNFYTPTVYNKGAEVIRIIHSRLGEAGFQKGMQLYFARHDGQAVTCDDFVQAMADANQIDLSSYLGWYAQAGTPTLTVKTDYDANTQTLTLTLSQHTSATPGQPEKQPLPIPVNLALLSENGELLNCTLEGRSATAHQVLLASDQQTYKLNNVTKAPVVSVLRDFSAPVKLEYQRGTHEYCTLIAHEQDAYSRYAAIQAIYEKLILHTNNDAKTTEALTKALRALLSRSAESPELVAKMLELPSYAILMDQQPTVDIDQLVLARRQCFANIADTLRDAFIDTYQTYAQKDTGTYATAPERALKNSALRFWSIAEQDGVQRAYKQAENAPNMTDELAALQALIFSDSVRPNPETQAIVHQALEAFYTRWSHDGQVIEKWLSLRAACLSEHDGIRELETLMSHPAFELTNPNRIRAVIGGFIRNIPLFHRADGVGYHKLADIIRQLDQQNPQMAAALCRGYSILGKLDDNRRQHINHALDMLREKAQSPNVREWVSKLQNT